METELRSNLIACASAFAAARSLSLSTVGRLVAKDGRFFDRLDDGSTFTARKYDEVIRWFSDSWPEDAVWPPSVERPAAEARA
jgi:hypothetical protein